VQLGELTEEVYIASMQTEDANGGCKCSTSWVWERYVRLRILP